jgi:hypothetical protein
MRIRRLTMNNFRSHQETVLELDRFNFIRDRMAAARARSRWLWNMCLQGDAN